MRKIERKPYPSIVNKPSPMVQLNVQWDRDVEDIAALAVNCKLTALQRKVINAFVSVIKTDYLFEDYEVSLVWLKEYCGVRGISNEEFFTAIHQLTKMHYSFRYRKGKTEAWVSCVIFPYIRTHINEFGESRVEFSVVSYIRNEILYPNIYVKLDQNVVSKFQSSYSIVVYEFLMDYAKIPIPNFTLEEFRDLLDLKDKYKDIRELRRRILDPVVKEINEVSGIECTYSLRKVHGKRHIQWFAGRKIPTTMTFNEINRMNDDPKHPRRPGESTEAYLKRIEIYDFLKDNT